MVTTFPSGCFEIDITFPKGLKSSKHMFLKLHVRNAAIGAIEIYPIIFIAHRFSEHLTNLLLQGSNNNNNNNNK